MDYEYYHDYENPNIPVEIVSIAQTSEAVYFASALSGLYKYDGNRFTSLTENKFFGEAKIKRIFSYKNNELIVVTDFNELFILNITSTGVKLRRK